MNQYRDENERYWQEYSNLQRVKHALIREYLNGWLPKLGSRAGRILYFETHAGRGRYLTGELGSPLIAVRTFLEHSFRDRILRKSEVCFFFSEWDQQNKEQLEEEIAQIGRLPSRILIQIESGESLQLLQEVVQKLHAEGSSMAPAFIFVDPFVSRLVR